MSNTTNHEEKGFVDYLIIVTAISCLLLASLGVEGFKVITLLGSEYLYYFVGLIVYSIVSPLLGLFIVSVLASTSSLVVLLKVLLRMPRPPQEEWLVHASGPGFPSGHSAISAVFWVLLVLLFSRKPRVSLPVALLVVALVSYSRVVLGVHYVIDVVGGVLIGIVIGLVAYKLYKTRNSLLVSLVLSFLALVMAGLASMQSPDYVSSLRLFGISLGLTVSILHIHKFGLSSLLEAPMAKRAKALILAIGLAGLFLALFVEDVIAGPFSSIVGFAVFSGIVVYSKPLMYKVYGSIKQ